MADTEEDKNKILAGLSYLILFLGFLGLIIDSIIYYATKNKYAKFHSGQAVFLAIVILVIAFIIALLGVGAVALLNPNPLSLFTASFSLISGFAILSYIIYVVCAIAAFAGKDFRIPVAAHLFEK